MAIHSSFLAWEIPWTEKPDGLQSMGVTKEQDTTYRRNSNNKPKTPPSNQQKPALAEHHPQGTPESLRSCTPKEHTEGRGGEQFLGTFLKQQNQKQLETGEGEGPSFGCSFFFFSLSLFKGSKANNLTLIKVSAQREKSPWKTGSLTRRVSETEIHHHVFFLFFPTASVACGRFNGVIYSTERPLSGPVK